MENESEFYVKPKCSRKRRRHFDEYVQDIDEGTVLQGEEGFRDNYFLNIMDQTIVSVETRFEQFESFSCFCREKFFKAEADKELSTIYNVTRQVE
ncbi:PREDICTED: uncharacterized protein LOC109126866 [Camelina sativa]|uniref:Uncharacterized protein LOC109126866 n=1 Tax=Camelina sativa TaxID=90675 RepID=A0ABM1QHQ9_CAMSA|nr:PREDICTED: uncharacterized protein LOC109126866 [Camelina sativa]